MAASKEDNTYVQLKSLIYATTIKTLPIAESNSNKLQSFSVKVRQLHLNQVTSGYL